MQERPSPFVGLMGFVLGAYLGVLGSALLGWWNLPATWIVGRVAPSAFRTGYLLGGLGYGTARLVTSYSHLLQKAESAVETLQSVGQTIQNVIEHPVQSLVYPAARAAARHYPYPFIGVPFGL